MSRPGGGGGHICTRGVEMETGHGFRIKSCSRRQTRMLPVRRKGGGGVARSSEQNVDDHIMRRKGVARAASVTDRCQVGSTEGTQGTSSYTSFVHLDFLFFTPLVRFLHKGC